MGLVRILHGMVGRFEQGQVVAEEAFQDVEHLIGLGAVERIPDVPSYPSRKVDATPSAPSPPIPTASKRVPLPGGGFAAESPKT